MLLRCTFVVSLIFGSLHVIAAEQDSPNQPDQATSPYALVEGAVDAAVAQPVPSQPAEGGASDCPYSFAPVSLSSGGTFASGGPVGDENLYSIIATLDWIGTDGPSTGGPYTLDVGFHHAASGPPACYGGSGLDCNNNGIDDECDIAVRISLDANDNCIPDECDDCLAVDQVANACRISCDALNGACSMVAGCGTSADLDLNGLPDECDPDCDGDMTPDAVDAPTVRIFVDIDAGGADNGLDWDNAFNDLQAALAAADAANGTDVVEVWVAEGTYAPGANRSDSFVLRSCVGVYGGFAGGETNIQQRDPVANVTVLSGDLLGNDVDPDGMDENSFHVVAAEEIPTPADASAILDGFTVRDGNANGGIVNTRRGGGLFTFFASPNVANCIFELNTATGRGGAVSQSQAGASAFTNCVFRNNAALIGGGLFASADATLQLTDCLIQSNTATENGGGVFVEDNSVPVLTNCRFEGNTAGINGGGMYNDDSRSVLVNTVFYDNEAQADGGAIYNSDSSISIHSSTIVGNRVVADAPGLSAGIANLNSNPSVTNSVLWGNTVEAGTGAESEQIAGGSPGVSFTLIEGLDIFDLPVSGNFDSDPSFIDELGGNLRLTSSSPNINRGRRFSLPLDPQRNAEGALQALSFDFDRGMRVVDGELDMGAYEWSDCNNNMIDDGHELATGVAGDCDGDGLLDSCESLELADFSAFFDCATGPDGGGLDSDCGCSDFDNDFDVDVLDFGVFQATVGG